MVQSRLSANLGAAGRSVCSECTDEWTATWRAHTLPVSQTKVSGWSLGSTWAHYYSVSAGSLTQSASTTCGLRFRPSRVI